MAAAPVQAGLHRSLPRGKTTTPSGNLGQRRSQLLEAAGVEQPAEKQAEAPEIPEDESEMTEPPPLPLAADEDE